MVEVEAQLMHESSRFDEKDVKSLSLISSEKPGGEDLIKLSVHMH